MIQIDALYLLLLIEAALLAAAASLFLFYRRSKCLELLRRAAVALKANTAGRAVVEDASEKATPGKQDSAPPAGPVQTGADDEALKTMVNRLQRIVDFQKTRLLDLMTYIEVLEQAQERLSAIRQNSLAVRDRFTTIFKTSRSPEEFGEVLNLFDENAGRLDEYLANLRNENGKLTDTFRAWEEELKRMWEEESPETCLDFSAIDGAHEALRGENEALALKINGLEQQLAGHVRQYDALKKQMENLEQEYLILYKRDQEHRGLE